MKKTYQIEVDCANCVSPMEDVLRKRPQWVTNMQKSDGNGVIANADDIQVAAARRKANRERNTSCSVGFLSFVLSRPRFLFGHIVSFYLKNLSIFLFFRNCVPNY